MKEEKKIIIPHNEYLEMVEENKELKQKLGDISDGIPHVVIDRGDIGVTEGGRIVSDRSNALTRVSLDGRFRIKGLIQTAPIAVIRSREEVIDEEIEEAIKFNEGVLKETVLVLKDYKKYAVENSIIKKKNKEFELTIIISISALLGFMLGLAAMSMISGV